MTTGGRLGAGLIERCPDIQSDDVVSPRSSYLLRSRGASPGSAAAAREP
jgi:hypothetical protein